MDILSRNAQTRAFAAIGQSLPTESRADELRETWRQNGIKSLYFLASAVLNWSLIQVDPHKPLCDFIQNVEPPHKKRKVLLIPRDTYKSTVGSKSFPIWVLIQPDFCGLPGREHRMLLWSHSSENAKKQIKSIRQQIERNTILQWLYPEIIPDFTRTTWTDSNLLFPREGSYGEDTIEAAGIDTHLVSRHYTLQVKDDLEDKASYESPAIREKVKETYRSAEALFVEERSAYDLLIGTRWGHNDVYDDILRNESDAYESMVRPLHWTRSELEADFREARESKSPPTWNMDPDTYAPDPTKKYYFFEKLFPEDSCKRIRNKMGSFMYSMLYLNNPKDPSLAEFREDDMRFFVFDDEYNLVLTQDGEQREIVPFDQCKRVMFWDPADKAKDQKKGARNAIVVAFRDPRGRIFIVDAFAEQKDPTLCMSRFISWHQRYHIQNATIEDVGFQRYLKFPLFQLMRELNYVFSVNEQTPVTDKDARIRSLIPFNEAHILFLRKGLRNVVEEMKAFPLFQYKDIVDGAAACLGLFGLEAVAGQYRHRKQSIAALANDRTATRSKTTGY